METYKAEIEKYRHEIKRYSAMLTPSNTINLRLHPLPKAYRGDTLNRCLDCKKIVWPWQKRGIDSHSHRGCHRRRCSSLLKEWGNDKEMLRIINNEINEIESVYLKVSS